MTKIAELSIPTTTQREADATAIPRMHARDVTDDAEATVKTITYAKHSVSHHAEVLDPMLVLVGLTVELEREYKET